MIHMVVCLQTFAQILTCCHISQEALENNRREITSAIMKSYPLLLQKYISDKAKVSPLVEIVVLLKLELYTLKRQEQVTCRHLHCWPACFSHFWLICCFFAFSRILEPFSSLFVMHSLNMGRRMHWGHALKLSPSVPVKVKLTSKILLKIS